MPIAPTRRQPTDQQFPRESHSDYRAQPERPKAAHGLGYGRPWRRLRDLFLHRHPLCGMRPGGQRPVLSRCADQGLTVLATDVDHVIPHRGDPALFYDLERNGQALCHDCHARKTFAGQ